MINKKWDIVLKDEFKKENGVWKDKSNDYTYLNKIVKNGIDIAMNKIN